MEPERPVETHRWHTGPWGPTRVRGGGEDGSSLAHGSVGHMAHKSEEMVTVMGKASCGRACLEEQQQLRADQFIPDGFRRCRKVRCHPNKMSQ